MRIEATERLVATKLSDLYVKDHRLDSDSPVTPEEIKWVNEQLIARGMTYKFQAPPPPSSKKELDGSCATSLEASGNKITYDPGVIGVTALDMPAADCMKVNNNEVKNPQGTSPAILIRPNRAVTADAKPK